MAGAAAAPPKERMVSPPVGSRRHARDHNRPFAHHSRTWGMAGRESGGGAGQSERITMSEGGGGAACPSKPSAQPPPIHPAPHILHPNRARQLRRPHIAGGAQQQLLHAAARTCHATTGSGEHQAVEVPESGDGRVQVGKVLIVGKVNLPSTPGTARHGHRHRRWHRNRNRHRHRHITKHITE
jgi:hypothetical protein